MTLSLQEPYFDPKLVEIWSRGGVAPLAIGPIDTTQAKALRHRLYTTRSRMRRVGHAEVDKANQATVALRDAEGLPGQSMVIVFPSNQLIDQALAAAGIRAAEPPMLD